MTHLESLKAACGAALIAGLRPGLKDALDAALAKGATRRQILARVRRLTGGPRARPGGLTYLAVEAYLRAGGPTPAVTHPPTSGRSGT